MERKPSLMAPAQRSKLAATSKRASGSVSAGLVLDDRTDHGVLAGKVVVKLGGHLEA
jgi:hypothetical protein